MAAQNLAFPVPFETNDLAVAAAAAADGANGVEQAQNLHLAHLMPASSRSKRDVNSHRDVDVIECAVPGMEYLEKELNVPRLNEIHDHLWWAGRPMPPRPLNYQVASSRAITVTEDIHLHLVWEPGRIFLKPLPRYLLDPGFWEEHLVCQQGQADCSCFPNPHAQPENPVAKPGPCRVRELYKCAYGFLLSYVALIQYESDYHIAASQHLLPEGTAWQSWRKLVWELLEESPDNIARVNKRYLFGELRVGRLNKIFRVGSLWAIWERLDDLMRGYKFEFATYGEQLEGYLAPLLAATAYILLVLTAMQVGLGTDTLRESLPFQRASYGFTVFSILAPLVLVAVVAFIVFVFVLFNYQRTRAFLQKRQAFYASLGH